MSRETYRVLELVLFLGYGLLWMSGIPKDTVYRGLGFVGLTLLVIGFSLLRKKLVRHYPLVEGKLLEEEEFDRSGRKLYTIGYEYEAEQYLIYLDNDEAPDNLTGEGWKLMVEVNPEYPAGGKAVMQDRWERRSVLHLYILIASLPLAIFLPVLWEKDKKDGVADRENSPSTAPVAVADTQTNSRVQNIDTLQWTRVTADSSLLLRIAYADTANFTRQRLYDCPECLLRPVVAAALRKARGFAAKQGLQIVLFDCYRPQSVQLKLYDFLPDKTYVADPGKGSKHSRGCAVDASLARGGAPLDMGSGFDDMSARAGYNWAGLSEAQRSNRRLLRDFFIAAGFVPYVNEWWHFSCKDCSSPVSDYRWPCR